MPVYISFLKTLALHLASNPDLFSFFSDVNGEALEGELGRLEDGLCFVNDLLWCSVESLNVVLCECLVRCVAMRPVMENMVVSVGEEGV